MYDVYYVGAQNSEKIDFCQWPYMVTGGDIFDGSVGVVTAVYSADGKAKVTFCGDYSVYSKPCGITDRSGFSVSGGTFSWTESTKEYKFMNNATYNWIAIGS